MRINLGLQSAISKVKDCSPLMKEFPLQDLLAATELQQIQLAIVAIFSHLKKVRNTQYPVSRVLNLVEAISRDLTLQLLKVSVGKLLEDDGAFCTVIRFLARGA